VVCHFTPQRRLLLLRHEEALVILFNHLQQRVALVKGASLLEPHLSRAKKLEFLPSHGCAQFTANLVLPRANQLVLV